MPTSAVRATPATIITFGRLGVTGLPKRQASRLLGQPKRLAVLLYVMLSQRGGTLSRDQVIGMFWPESDASRARNALRQTLSFLRGCLGADAIEGVGTNGLRVSSALVCDAMQFEWLLDANHREQALTLYSGDFLSGFYVDGGHAIQDWIETQRRRHSQRAAKAAWDLSAACEARHDQVIAAYWGKRALSLSPFSESEVQRVLRLLARVGDYAGALRAFHGLQNALQSEFGTVPSAETARLAADIMAHLKTSGHHVPAMLGSRRVGVERRVGERRHGRGDRPGKERRSGSDRRTNERRSGNDRRVVR